MGLFNNEREIRRDIMDKFNAHPCDYHKEQAESMGMSPDWSTHDYEIPKGLVPDYSEVRYDEQADRELIAGL